MATTIFDWQYIQNAASDLPTGLYFLSAKQVAYLLAVIENKSLFRGNWAVGGEQTNDTEWDEISAFTSDTERALMVANNFAFLATKTGGQTIQPDTRTKVSLNSAIFGASYLDLPNNRFIAPMDGKFSIIAMVTIDLTESGAWPWGRLEIAVNGTGFAKAKNWGFNVGSSEVTSLLSVVPVNVVENDYVEFFIYQHAGENKTIWAGKEFTFLSGFFVGDE